ncbi:hypothetical protein BWI17_00850 [Betaproteobacteria bacterium GR16-43]|nr:hypothetical protein BWI17_00850 [Betaproteobacteria bacterium GR16-43]
MLQSMRALAALLLSLAAFGAQAFVWFGDNRGLHRVDAASNVSDVQAATAEPVSMAIDPNDGAVWSVSRTRVSKFTKDGVLVFSRALSSYASNIGSGRKVVVNQPEATVWVAGERRVLRLARDGSLLAVLQGGGATDLQIQYGDSLWVLDSDRDELRHYNYDGSFAGTTDLGGASARARFLAIDDARGILWLGANNALVQRDINAPSVVLRRVDTSHAANAISLDAERGELWVLGGNGFHGYRADGTRFKTEHFANDGVNDPGTLVFDFDTQDLWIGHRRGLSRFTRDGARVATIPADDSGTLAVSREAAYFVPMLFMYSLFGETVADRQPAIVFKFIAECSTYSCPFPPEFYANHSIVADLDGVNISAGFIFDPATAETRFVPPAPLTQGYHLVTARAVDPDGRVSVPAYLWFTVDTVGPSLIAISPPNGALVTTPSITVTGSFDPSAVSVTLPGGAVVPGNAFSFEAPLALGANTFSLNSVDELGNVGPVALTYTFELPNAPPSVSIVQPATGAVFPPVPGSFTVVANASDPDGSIARVEFFRNNASIGIALAPPYRVELVNVPPGTYTLFARATDDRGRTTQSANVQVRVDAPPLVTLLEPADGIVVSGGIPIRANVSDPDGTVTSIQVLINGQVSWTVQPQGPEFRTAVVFLVPGLYTIAVRVKDNNGVSTDSSAVHVTALPFGVTVDSPARDATVSAGNVTVSGTFNAPAGATIRVNGVPAVLLFDASGYSGTFSAIVPMAVGQNQISTELISPDGTSISTIVNVTVVP